MSRYLPPLAELISLENLPESLGFLEDAADSVFAKLYFKDLYVARSRQGEAATYSLTLVSKARLALDIAGGEDGLALVLNPDLAPGGTSDFPLALSYHWPLLKFLDGDELAEFDFSPRSFFDLVAGTSGFSDGELLHSLIRGIYGGEEVEDPIQLFVDDFNARHMPPAPLFKLASEDDAAVVEDLVAQLSAGGNDLDAFDLMFGDYLGTAADLDELFEKLRQAFRPLLGHFTLDDAKRFLLPKIAARLASLSLALEFPRTWLQPVDLAGELLPGTPKSLLRYDVGALLFSTETGFDFEGAGNFSFTRSQIGDTGLIVVLDGLKLDLRTDSNIPEADADGRSADFRGIYAETAAITLPAKWFKDPDGTNARISGRQLLIGTGGISGKIALEALGGDNLFWVKLGESSGFRLGFGSFDIQFKQNKVESSNIAGAMEIAKFVYPAGHPNAGQTVRIAIAGHLHDDGDFNLTASTDPGFPIELPDVFVYEIRSLELGRDDAKFYVGTSGKLEFQGFLKDTLKLGAIEVEKLRIYSDGSIEFAGGSLCLVEPIVLPLGPVEITVTAIHYGSHQKEVGGAVRKFNYFGFDGGISVDPLGIEVRGDGVKYYYCTDGLPNPPSPYLHIKTLYLDLTIPASSPAVILNGWLSIPEPGVSPEYAGGIKLQIPQAKIAGSADMKLAPRYPAFIVDASIELPLPIPLGPVAIYGFRGLIGYRYVAEKEAIGLMSGVHSWYDYYKHPPRGIHVSKFSGPDRTKTSGTPFSVGAGASLGTSVDNGTILNIKAMILLSIPSLFMIDGRAAVLSARLGLDDPGEPPFFAFIAVGDSSLELGFGADFKLPTFSGDIIALFAEVQAGFFFNDSSRWYVNFGTRNSPITARIVRILTIQSFLMLSARGIEAGARGELAIGRSYGPVRVRAWAYIELGGKISFERPQFGAYMAAGVGADIDIKIVSLYASFDVIFGVEGAKPFKIFGKFRLCVRIKIFWVFSFRFCGDLAIVWEFNSDIDRTPIDPMRSTAGAIGERVKGVSMLSGETFELVSLGGDIPADLPPAVVQKVIPLDTYIDLKSEKGLIPNAVGDLIGGVTNPPLRYLDLIPPESMVRGQPIRQVTHQYSLTGLEIKSWNPASGSWQDYHPWKALYPNDPALDPMHAGQFQKTDGQYNTIRLLATTPFSFSELGEEGWNIPEQYGLTPGVLFCQGEARVERCADFLAKPLGHRYTCPNDNSLFFSNQAAFLLRGHAEGEFAEVVAEPNPFAFARSLRIEGSHRLQIRLPQPSMRVGLRLTSEAREVRISYFAHLRNDQAMEAEYGNPDPGAPHLPAHSVVVPRAALGQPVVYEQPDWLPVTRIEVEPLAASPGGGGNTVGFVNGYRDPHLRLRSAATFAEPAGARTYAVGNTDKGAVLVKTDPDGATEFCLELQVGSALRFYEIVQLLEEGDRLSYVISAYDGTLFYLVAVDASGKERWSVEVDTKDADLHAFLLPKPDRHGFYFVYSDKNGVDSSLTPKLLSFAADGKLTGARELQTPGTRHDGFVVNTAGTHAGGLVLAGRLLRVSGRETMGVAIELKSDFGVVAAETYERLSIQDVAAGTSDGHLLSAYDAGSGGVALLKFPSLEGQVAYLYPVPGTKNRQSLLCAGAGGCYLSTHNKGGGSVSFLEKGFAPQWTKSLELDENELGVVALSWDEGLSLLTVVSGEDSLLGVAGPELDTCLTVEKPRLKLGRQELKAARLVADTKAFAVRIVTARGSWTPLRPLRDLACPPGGTGGSAGDTLVHQVCWLSLEDYQYNLFVPGQDAIEADVRATIAGLTDYIQPIWRPDTSYVVRIALEDKVDNQMDAAAYNYAFGFTTGGPVGFFHRHPHADYGDPAHPDQSPLTSLRAYIDYARSYPNADGNLLGAKPLFYDSELTRIDLFFQKAWTRHFFHTWPAYNGLPPAAGRIKLVIKDPAEGTEIVNPPQLDYDPAATEHVEIPQTVESWQDDPDPVVPHVYRQYQHLLEAQQCVLWGGEVIKPRSEYTRVFPKHLKPDKLYTVLVNNLYDLDKDGDWNSPGETCEVHSFTFRTSRYKDFAEQVGSYLLSHGEGTSAQTRPAIFSVAKPLTAAEVAAARAAAAGASDALSDGLANRWRHPYDRVIEGIFALPPLTAALTTEFNLIRNAADGGRIVALLIRNPEPFNNPRMPLAEVQGTVAVLDAAGHPAPGYRVLFSPDYSRAIVMHDSLEIAGPLTVRFQYKLWNGSAWVVPGTPEYGTDLVGTVVVGGLDFTSF
jgi:hypothetical protein